jgi:hypothetical protein
MDAEEKRKILNLRRESNPRAPIVKPVVAVPNELPQLPLNISKFL